ncbi:hypothetical protein BaRGS_00022350 [Batillaria attramentaria]|uniref:Signal peptide, CUB and EGF-like domain-containing protein 2 n=1 Tax=Batillaria attramentaria TaxID=370345 RepID=A0ABD0KHM8_9CAEN
MGSVGWRGDGGGLLTATGMSNRKNYLRRFSGVASGLCVAKDCERGTHNCHKDADCITSRRSYRCKCKDGFYGDGKICVDDDECKYENGGCVHRCQNTPGNFSCSCYQGFVLAPDGLDCIDKNECEERQGGCSHECINSLGSYECRCRSGYTLDSDGRKCVTGSWCRSVLGCEHHCSSSTSQNLRCACREGYQLAPDEKHCIKTCSVGNGGCQHKCTDTASGPKCTCAPKYILASDKKSCIASCGVKNGGCERKCRDSPAGPVCSCPAGYRIHQDGRSCLDVDECLEGNGGCSHQCVNTHGSYECVCPPGHKVAPDQKGCVDIDECVVKESCDHECTNVAGSYRCSCRKGYQPYGVTHCADTNECAVQNGGCKHTCINTEGTYRCTCQPGYKLHPNGRDCVQAQQCIPLKISSPATLDCHGTHLSRREQRCTLSCPQNARFVSRPGSHVTVTCGFTTNYRWLVNGRNDTIPTCSDQKRYKCKSMCQVNTVNVTCGSRIKKLKRLVRGTRDELVTAEVEIQMNSKHPTKKCDSDCMANRTFKRFKRSFRKMKKAVRQKKFQVKFEGREHLVLRKSFQADKKLVQTCSPGYVLVDKMCVACSMGTFYDTSTSTCVPCAAGTYQNREGKLRCKSCASLSVTGPPGATSRKQCTELCAPGYFSSNGSVPCIPCPTGTFQSQAGRTTCLPCGGGITTTSQPAAFSFSHCRAREICRSGHYYDISTSTCKACAVGTYQPESGQNFCHACPGATSTDGEASSRLDDCKDQECGEYMGEYFGIIRTPNYPGNYPNNVNCVWKIKPEKGRRILIIIPDIFLHDADACGDVLVMRKSKSPHSRTTYETCVSRNTPIAFTARSKKLWIQFKSDGNNTSGGFSIPFVAYNEEYQSLIEDIVTDGRLYSSYQHQQIFKDRELLHGLLEVIATPYHYLKYANVSRSMFPHSFIRFLTPKVRKFFEL